MYYYNIFYNIDMKNNKINRYNNKSLHKSNTLQSNTLQSNTLQSNTSQSLESSSQNGGIINSIFGSVIQGAALGTGSELAGRALDSLIGPKKIELNNSDKCTKEIDLYTNCINNNDNDLTLCKNYFELLTQCRKNNI